MNAIVLRPATAHDKIAIAQWPAYPAEFHELDYALRTNGWLDEFQGKPDTWIYVAERDKAAVAFSLLTTTSEREAEFRIALHPHYLGQGLGKPITLNTLELGFRDKELKRIYLIVRKDHHRAIRLYAELGFSYFDCCILTVNGNPVEFRRMEVFRN
ncbi:MAG: GNAT family N-acetyltransferase [Gammaproteobacteria bacterium]|jgi:RimJ/RimL family protein N-acetyltransferase